MKYIVGLGNPGEKYSFTRHNIGFLVLDKVAEIVAKNQSSESSVNIGKRSVLKSFFNIVFRGSEECKGWQRNKNLLLYQVFDDLYLVKPMTYMNLSGEIFKYLDVEDTEKVLVVVDEIYLPLGRVRFRNKGSAGGHNGLKSIESALGTDKYSRLRVGVGSVKKAENSDSEATVGSKGLIDFVLGRFEDDEAELLDKVVLEAAKGVLDWYSADILSVQQKYNGIDLRF